MGTVNPKVILNKMYGPKASYEIVAGPADKDTSKNKQDMFRCTLTLPEFSVTSGLFCRKKEAEQAAARMVLQKLRTHPSAAMLLNKPLTKDQNRRALIDRLTRIFSDSYFRSCCPLDAHSKAAAQSGDVKYGMLPAAVVVALDKKVADLCKLIDGKAENSPSRALQVVSTAVTESRCFYLPGRPLWIGKELQISDAAKKPLVSSNLESHGVLRSQAVRIPSSPCEEAQSLILEIKPREYFMDAIAKQLKAWDSSYVLISRPLGKPCPSSTRLYFPFQDASNASDGPRFNSRASSLACQTIYGDAIVAAIGYTWESKGSLRAEDISLNKYHRAILSQSAQGLYKISRNAIWMAELPTKFTTFLQWRGALPRDLLIAFCQRCRLCEPAFHLCMDDSALSIELKENFKAKLQISERAPEDHEHGIANMEKPLDVLGSKGMVKCAVKVMCKRGDLVISCVSDPYCNEIDAVQSAAFKALLLLDEWSERKLHSGGDSPRTPIRSQSSEFLNSRHEERCGEGDHETMFDAIEGRSPTAGSMVSISYTVGLQDLGLEAKDEFEFEFGTGAIIPQVEARVGCMCVGQKAWFHERLHSIHLLLAAAGEKAHMISDLISGKCRLEYEVELLKVEDPLEEMSCRKERAEYALHLVVDSAVQSLDALGSRTDDVTNLASVDISQRSLFTAAKTRFLAAVGGAPEG